MENKKIEFAGVRAKLYEQALARYPNAREDDIKIMKKLLNPKTGEHILGFGEGNGFFCNAIAEAVGSTGKYLITDPSQDQLKGLESRVKCPWVEVKVAGAEELNVGARSFDKVWSFGAFHHCPNQTMAMKHIYNSLRYGGKVVICDVFQGSNLAKHFDVQVARYCNTGHEVKFLSDEFARSLCYLAGFEDSKVKIVEFNQKWRFDNEKSLGDFVYKLHAMTKLSGNMKEKIDKTVEGCRDILGYKFVNGLYELNWPMKALVAEK